MKRVMVEISLSESDQALLGQFQAEMNVLLAASNLTPWDELETINSVLALGLHRIRFVQSMASVTPMPPLTPPAWLVSLLGTH